MYFSVWFERAKYGKLSNCFLARVNKMDECDDLDAKKG